jgi:hypothetical protein
MALLQFSLEAVVTVLSPSGWSGVGTHGDMFQVKAVRQNLVAIPFVGGAAHQVLEVHLLTADIFEGNPQMALALIWNIVNDNDKRGTSCFLQEKATKQSSFQFPSQAASQSRTRHSPS